MAMEPERGLLFTLMKVRREELSLTLFHFVYLLCAVGAFVLGRNVAAALFLSEYGSTSLPWMYVASATAVSLAAWSYARVTGRIRLDKLILATLVALALVLVGLRLAMVFGVPLVYPALYVLVEVMGALVVIQFWSLANTLHDTREAKRLFGFIGAGGVLANIFVGFGAAALVLWTGTENLVFVMVLCLIVCGILVGILGRHGRQQLVQALDGPVPRRRARGIAISRQTVRVFSSRHLRLVAAIVALTFVVTTLVDYQFKILAHRTYDKEALTAFFSLLYGFTGILALLIQVFLTSRLLDRFGILFALALLPLSLALGSAALLLVPLAIVAAMAKGADAVFRYTVNDVTLQLLYLPVPPQARLKAKAFIDGILKPVAYGLTGLLLVGTMALYPGLEERVHLLAIPSAALALVWVGLVVGLRGEYVRSLVDTLRRRRLDLSDARLRLDDESALRVLSAALSSEDADEVTGALELVEHVADHGLDETVAGLVDHPDARVRRLAIVHLGRRGSLQWANDVFRGFEDEDEAVRAAAIEAYCAIGREKALLGVAGFLDDPAPAIRAATMTGMIRWGGLDGVLRATTALKRLLEDPDPDLRGHGARVLGLVGVSSFYQPILTLMSDPDPAVRRAAIDAAGSLKSPELVPALVYKLGDAHLCAAAADALVAFGPKVERTLAKVLENEMERRTVRLNVPRVLARLGTPFAAGALVACLDVRDETLRTRVHRALARLHVRHPAIRIDARRVDRALDAEIALGFARLGQMEDFGLDGRPLTEGGLLALALEERFVQGLDRIFLLLSLRFHARTIEAVRAGLDSEVKTVRGNALEVLENTLDRELRRRLMPLVDERPRAEKIAFGILAGHLEKKTPAEHLGRLLQDESAWIVACTLHHLDRITPAPDSALGAQAAALTEAATPLVRETALLVASRHLETDAAAPLLSRLALDEDPGVRGVAGRARKEMGRDTPAAALHRAG
jgi:ATP/ADP translocase/HEAT repeat protein